MKKLIRLNSSLFLLLIVACSNHPVQEKYSQETKPNPLRMLSHDINDSTKQEIQVHTENSNPRKAIIKEPVPIQVNIDETNREDANQENVSANSLKEDEKTIAYKIGSGEDAVIATRKYLEKKRYPFKGNERIRFDNLNGDIYLIQLYEGFPDHIATINWFEVNRVTGNVVPMFDF